MNVFKFFIIILITLISINLVVSDYVLIKHVNALTCNNTMDETNLFSKIKDVMIKNSTDDDYIHVIYPKLKIVKIIRVKDEYSEDGKEQYLLIVEPIKNKE